MPYQLLLFTASLPATSESANTVRMIGYGLIAAAALGYVYWQRRKDKQDER